MEKLFDLVEICLWPDGTWCYPEDLDDYAFMSDDYIRFYTDERVMDHRDMQLVYEEEVSR